MQFLVPFSMAIGKSRSFGELRVFSFFGNRMGAGVRVPISHSENNAVLRYF